jgi:hypothetical protein
MKTCIKTILFSLTAVLLFTSVIQSCFNWPIFKPLKGVVVEQSMPELNFQNYCDGSYQQQTEQHLKQHFGCREPLIRLYNQYLWDFYGKTPVTEGQVSFGKDGWMYEPWVVADHYQRQFRYYASDSTQMATMLSEEAQRVLQLQEILESYGIRLFVCLVPAKDLIFPEYLPENQDTRYDDEPKISARFFNEEEYTRLGVNHLNLERWFLQMKDTADFMLFPKTGTHWARYAALQSADTLIRYMEHLDSINMHNLVLGQRYLHNAIDPDDDLESLLNLMRPLPKPKYYYADATTDGDTMAIKPKMIVIGDSFWWTIAVQLPLGEIFSQVPYWYYNSTVYYDERYNSVDEFDLAEELLSADFVVLFYCATQQYRMNDGFTQKAIEALGQVPEGAELDSAAFIEREIQRIIAQYLADHNSMDMIRQKAETNGVSIEKQLHDDAIWIVNYQIEHGTFNWPARKRDMNEKSDSYGIQ